MNTSHHNISTAFECLHEEIEQAVVAVQLNAAQRIQQGDYTAAEGAIAEAKWISEFQKTILDLQESWSSHWSTRSKSEPGPKPSNNRDSAPGTTPAAFHAQCLKRAEAHLSCTFLKRSRSSYVSRDGTTALVCSVSKFHEGGVGIYWFSFHPYQQEFLESFPTGYLLLGCGNEWKCLLIPIAALKGWLDSINTTQTADTYYHHLKIQEENGDFLLILKGRGERASVGKYLIS